MKFWKSASIAVPLMLTALVPAQAACYFSPYSFFPDRNDQVQIQVTTESGQSCAMAFLVSAGNGSSWPGAVRQNQATNRPISNAT